jgi:hypothetical protein
MLDETVTCWLGLDTFHAEEDREDAIDQMRQRAESLGVEQPQVEPIESPGAESPGAEAERSPRSVRREVRRSPDQTGAAPDEADGERPIRERGGGSFVVNQPRRAAQAERRAGEGSADAGDAAKLHVGDTGAFGVRITFAAHNLDNIGFRASMPLRGVTSGESAPEKLIARPLAWVSKSTGHQISAGEIEARYEVRPRAHQTPREIVEAMTAIDELPPPFNQPMPYYLSHAESSKVKMHCESYSTPAGVQCQVTVPSLRYALEWVGRVNGVCGEEYSRLEAETLRLDAEAWRTIPVGVRHRLAVWFDFERDEQFLGYFNDSDFAKSDAGLAGLVVTDQRIVWCKYHHHGTMALDEPATLVALEDGRFADLYCHQGGTRRKLVRLRSNDADELADLLSQIDCATEMRIELADHRAPPGQEGDPSDVRIAE